jgi:hypothetical protein
MIKDELDYEWIREYQYEVKGGGEHDLYVFLFGSNQVRYNKIVNKINLSKTIVKVWMK